MRGHTLIRIGAHTTTVIASPARWFGRTRQLTAPIVLSHGDGSTRDIVEQLAHALNDVALPKRLDIVLSGPQAQFAVLPPCGDLRTTAERALLTRRVFERHYGSLAAHWSFLASPASTSEPTLACAVPTQLLEELRQQLGSVGAVTSIRPRLMDVFNTVRPSLEKDPEAGNCLALVEPGHLVLACARNGVWTSVVGRHCDPEDRNALTHLLAEQSILENQLTAGNLWVDDPGNCMDLSDLDRWNVRAVKAEPN